MLSKVAGLSFGCLPENYLSLLL